MLWLMNEVNQINWIWSETNKMEQCWNEFLKAKFKEIKLIAKVSVREEDNLSRNFQSNSFNEESCGGKHQTN